MTQFSLMFFASSQEALGPDKYRLVRECAIFGDRNDFGAVWVPERHFTEFGSLYPNPAVLQAALASITSRIRLHAGSVVAPLHDPLRIAEEWSVVDNLSQGRVGVSFAPGWNPADFVLAPDRYETRSQDLADDVLKVQRLWRGEMVNAEGGAGRVDVRIYPRPVQPELPTWITAAGSAASFERAGRLGANLLTHLLDQEEAQLGEKVALYRRARAEAGYDPQTGIVTLMLHSFVGEDSARCREEARAPFCAYIRNNIGLLNDLAASRGQTIDVTTLSGSELDAFVSFLYERFASTRGLIGTPEDCLPFVKRLAALGVDDIACLLDFGPPADRILDNLTHLDRLRRMAGENVTGDRYALSDTDLSFDVLQLQAASGNRRDGNAFRREMERFGLHISGRFDVLRALWPLRDGALGEIILPDDKAGDNASVLIDAASRTLMGAVDPDTAGSGASFMPASLGRVTRHGPICGGRFWSRATLHPRQREADIIGDIVIQDDHGQTIVEIDSLIVRRIAQAADRGAVQDPTETLFYQRDWQAMTPAQETARIWAVADDAGEDSVALTRALCALGEDARIVSISGRAGLAEAAATGAIVVDPAWSERSLSDMLSWARHVAAETSLPRAAWLLTRGALWTETDGSGISPTDAAITALMAAQALQAEAMPLSIGVLDMPYGPPDMRTVAEALIGAGNEQCLAVRGNGLRAARLRRAEVAPPGEAPRFSGDDLCVVTGAGGIGHVLVDWLIEHGARRILLLSRTRPAWIDGRSEQEGDVWHVACDIGDFAALEAAITRAEAEVGVLGAVFHLAGVLDDAPLAVEDAERFGATSAAKASGAHHLDRIARTRPVRHFVLFSSMATLVTLPGQGAYAAANGVLDALAQQRRADGLPALSVSWGPWGDIGHAASDYGRRAHAGLHAMGISALSPSDALSALGRAMTDGPAHVAIVDIDWAVFGAQSDRARMAFFADLVKTDGTTPELNVISAATPTLLALATLSSGARSREAIRIVGRQVAETLRLTDDRSDPDRPLFEMGLDSIIALELSSRLSAWFGLTVPATLFFSHGTVRAVAAEILRRCEGMIEAVTEPERNEPEEEDSEALQRMIAEEIGGR